MDSALVLLYCPNLVVNYYLMISYPHQCHIGINFGHWYGIIIAIHITLLFAFSRAEHLTVFISY